VVYLMGNSISKVWVSKDRRALAFVTKQPWTIVYETVNDCCNDVWFAAVTGLTSLLKGKEIIRVVADTWVKQGLDDMGQGTTVAWWSLTTEKGVCQWEIRNCGNEWYYGGKIRKMDDNEAAKWWRHDSKFKPEKDGWTKLTQDFIGYDRSGED